MATRLYTITDSADFLLFEGVTGYSSEGEQFAIQKSNIVKIKAINLAIPSSSGVGISMVDLTDYAFSYTELVDPATGLPFVSLAALMTSLETLAGQVAGGGGSAITADGDTMYSNVTGDFTATVDDGTKDIIIALNTFSFDETNIVSMQLINSTPELITLPISGSTVALGVITVTNAADNFALGDKVIVTLQGPKKAYNAVYDATKTLTQNPEYAHTTVPQVLANAVTTPFCIVMTAQNAAPSVDTFENDGLAIPYGEYNLMIGGDGLNETTGEVLSQGMEAIVPNTSIFGLLTNGGQWTAGDIGIFTGVRRYIVSMDTYKYLTLHYRITTSVNDNVNMRIFGTNDVNANISSRAGWVDMSTFFLGATNINSNGDTKEDIIMPTTPVTLEKLMIELTSNIFNSALPEDIEYTLIVKKA